MIEVRVTSSSEFEQPTVYWVHVAAPGAERLVASCPYPHYAEAVAQALREKLTDDNVETLLSDGRR